MAGFFNRLADKFQSDKFVAAILVAACFFVYANALLNDFVWDDEEQIANNLIIRDWGNLPLVFTSSTFYAGGAGLSGGFYRPLVTLSYFLNYSLWGLNPIGYHLMQVMLHSANVFLVFYLLKILFAKNNIANGRLAAAAAALVFAIHPANVESVAYAGSIGEVGYSFLMLAGMILFVKSFDGSGLIAQRKYFYGSFLLIFLALLAKESAIMALFLMLAYLMIFVKSPKIERNSNGSSYLGWPVSFYMKSGKITRIKDGIYLNFLIISAAIVGLYMFLRLCVAKIAPVSVFYAPIHLAPLYQRLLTVPYEVFSYIGIIFFPKDLSVCRHFVVGSAADPRFWQPLILLVLAAALIFLYIFKTRSKIFAFFILWFAVGLAPVLNIIPLDMTMAERWLYMPMIGLLAAAGLAVADFLNKLAPVKRNSALVFLAIAAAALGARTIARNFDWRNGLALYGHDIALAQIVSPQGSYDLENNYGVELFRAGAFGEAGDRFKKSIDLQPDWSFSQNNLGAVLERQGDLEGALGQYRKAAKMGYYLAHENTAGILIKMKRYDEAKKFLEESLAKLPGNAKLQFNLAYLYAADNIGNGKEAKQKALYLLSLVLQSDPQNQPARRLYFMLENRRKIEL